MNEDPRDSHLFELFSATIQKGLEYVRLAKTGRTRIGTHANWPRLQWHDSGLPYITNGVLEGPNDYSEAIRGSLYSFMYGLGSGALIPDFRKEGEFRALVHYATTQPRLCSYFMFEKASDYSEHRLLGVVGGVLDRYVHVNNLVEFERDKLLPVYLPIEKYLFEETLPAVLVVPILLVKFEPDSFRVNESISIQRLSDELHMARGWRGPWASSDNSMVEGAATHALYISNLSLTNHNWVTAGEGKMWSQSLELVNTFIAALRISTGYTTGYAQLLTLPVGWASGYAADLTPLDVATVPNYPPAFERIAWNDEVPTLSQWQTESVGEAFRSLQQALDTKLGQKIRLALHRLNLSSMRTTDEDGVIDAMIAMESLLSDGTQEMTHKVAMRLAGLYKLEADSRCVQAFREMKQIYKFRSKIVHGDLDLDKSRELDRDGIRIPTIDAAIDHLRSAIAVLCKHPTLLDPQEIDKYLLTDHL